MHSVIQERMRTFDRSGRKVSEETDGHFQNISFLQLGVAGVVFANQRENQAFQMTETVVDASAPSLLQQGFKSLEKNNENPLISCTFKSVKSETFPVTKTAV